MVCVVGIDARTVMVPVMSIGGPIAFSTIDLIDIINLKWLLAGQGLRIHVERLQSDPLYAAECLSQAAHSPNEATRRLAKRLTASLPPVA